MCDEGMALGVVHNSDVAFARMASAQRDRDMNEKRGGNPAFGKKRQRR